MRIKDRVSSALAWAGQCHRLVTGRGVELFSVVSRRANSPAILVGCLMALAATALLLRPSMTVGEAAAERGWASIVTDTILFGDTTVVYGPVKFTTVNGDTAWHIETFSIADTAQAHELVIQFGDTLGGAHRPDHLEVYLQGTLVATEADFASGAWLLTIPIVPLSSNDLEVMVSGSAGDYVRLAVLSFPSSAVTIFGPVSYTAFSHTFDTIALPPGVRAPYYLSFSSDDEATEIQTLLNLNGTGVFSDTLLSAAMTEVQLQALNELETKLSAPLGESGSIRIIGTDDVDPVLTISTPSDSAIVSTTSVTLAGTVADATWVTLTVNGEKITVGTDGSFSESVPLTEGANSLVVIARDAAGNATQHELDVFRDKTAPVVTITTPVTGQVTGEDSILVSGSAVDASDVTVTFTRMVLGDDGTIETPGFHEITLTAPRRAVHRVGTAGRRRGPHPVRCGGRGGQSVLYTDCRCA